MLKTTPKDILRAYSEGRIGWREACRQLDLEKFSELDAQLKKHGLRQYQPDPAESSARMSELDKWLYDEGEQ